MTTRVGDAIAAARRERGLSRYAFARRCGYACSQIECVEKGRYLPKAATLVDIATALGADVEHLCCLWVLDKYDQAREQIRVAGGWT
jgi:transcriptional regulator with XRE-family HTH domain